MNVVPGLADAIRATSQPIGANPLDLATAMSYKTAGTFDLWKAGPIAGVLRLHRSAETRIPRPARRRGFCV